ISLFETRASSSEARGRARGPASGKRRLNRATHTTVGAGRAKCSPFSLTAASTARARGALGHRIRRRRLLWQRDPLLVVSDRQWHAPGAPIRLRLLDTLLRR